MFPQREHLIKNLMQKQARPETMKRVLPKLKKQYCPEIIINSIQ